MGGASGKLITDYILMESVPKKDHIHVKLLNWFGYGACNLMFSATKTRK